MKLLDAESPRRKRSRVQKRKMSELKRERRFLSTDDGIYNPRDDNPHRCKLCPLTYKRRAVLEFHLRSIHRVPVPMMEATMKYVAVQLDEPASENEAEISIQSARRKKGIKRPNSASVAS